MLASNRVWQRVSGADCIDDAAHAAHAATPRDMAVGSPRFAVLANVVSVRFRCLIQVTRPRRLLGSNHELEAKSRRGRAGGVLGIGWRFRIIEEVLEALPIHLPLSRLRLM